jgi:hypothetical protein
VCHSLTARLRELFHHARSPLTRSVVTSGNTLLT